MKTQFLFFLSLFSLGLLCQEQDLPDFLKEKCYINSITLNYQVNTNEQNDLKANYAKILSYIEMDRGDSLILSEPTIAASVLIDATVNGELETNNDLKIILEKYIHSEEYVLFKPDLVRLISVSKVTLSKGFDEDEDVQFFLAYNSIETDEFLAFVIEEDLYGSIFYDAFQRFKKNQEAEMSYDNYFQESYVSNYSWYNIADSVKTTNKPALLYFTGWGVVNGRKMEEIILNKKVIHQELKKYNCFSIYVDDRTKVDPNKKAFKGFTTYGNYWSDIQKKKFDADAQPYFVILDHKMKPILTQSFTLDETEFRSFLEKGLEILSR